MASSRGRYVTYEIEEQTPRISSLFIPVSILCKIILEIRDHIDDNTSPWVDVFSIVVNDDKNILYRLFKGDKSQIAHLIQHDIGHETTCIELMCHANKYLARNATDNDDDDEQRMVYTKLPDSFTETKKSGRNKQVNSDRNTGRRHNLRPNPRKRVTGPGNTSTLSSINGISRDDGSTIVSVHGDTPEGDRSIDGSDNEYGSTDIDDEDASSEPGSESFVPDETETGSFEFDTTIGTVTSDFDSDADEISAFENTKADMESSNNENDDEGVSGNLHDDLHAASVLNTSVSSGSSNDTMIGGVSRFEPNSGSTPIMPDNSSGVSNSVNTSALGNASFQESINTEINDSSDGYADTDYDSETMSEVDDDENVDWMIVEFLHGLVDNAVVFGGMTYLPNSILQNVIDEVTLTYILNLRGFSLYVYHMMRRILGNMIQTNQPGQIRYTQSANNMFNVLYTTHSEYIQIHGENLPCVVLPIIPATLLYMERVKEFVSKTHSWMDKHWHTKMTHIKKGIKTYARDFKLMHGGDERSIYEYVFISQRGQTSANKNDADLDVWYDKVYDSIKYLMCRDPIQCMLSCWLYNPYFGIWVMNDYPDYMSLSRNHQVVGMSQEMIMLFEGYAISYFRVYDNMNGIRDEFTAQEYKMSICKIYPVGVAIAAALAITPSSNRTAVDTLRRRHGGDEYYNEVNDDDDDADDSRNYSNRSDRNNADDNDTTRASKITEHESLFSEMLYSIASHVDNDFEHAFYVAISLLNDASVLPMSLQKKLKTKATHKNREHESTKLGVDMRNPESITSKYGMVTVPEYSVYNVSLLQYLYNVLCLDTVTVNMPMTVHSYNKCDLNQWRPFNSLDEYNECIRLYSKKPVSGKCKQLTVEIITDERQDAFLVQLKQHLQGTITNATDSGGTRINKQPIQSAGFAFNILNVPNKTTFGNDNGTSSKRDNGDDGTNQTDVYVKDMNPIHKLNNKYYHGYAALQPREATNTQHYYTSTPHGVRCTFDKPTDLSISLVSPDVNFNETYLSPSERGETPPVWDISSGSVEPSHDSVNGHGGDEDDRNESEVREEHDSVVDTERRKKDLLVFMLSEIKKLPVIMDNFKDGGKFKQHTFYNMWLSYMTQRNLRTLTSSPEPFNFDMFLSNEWNADPPSTWIIEFEDHLKNDNVIGGGEFTRRSIYTILFQRKEGERNPVVNSFYRPSSGQSTYRRRSQTVNSRKDYDTFAQVLLVSSFQNMYMTRIIDVINMCIEEEITEDDIMKEFIDQLFPKTTRIRRSTRKATTTTTTEARNDGGDSEPESESEFTPDGSVDADDSD